MNNQFKQKIQNQVTPITVKSLSENNLTIEGYASVYNIVDQSGDIIIKGAFSEADHNKVKLLWQHDQEKPIGIIKSLKEDAYGLKMQAVINGNITTGKEAISLVTEGILNGLSVGFYSKATAYNDEGQRMITEAELMEVSIVTFPANQYAQINNTNNVKGEKMNPEILTQKTFSANMEFDKAQDQSIAKINRMEADINHIKSFLGRPDEVAIPDFEQKKAFGDYLRKGQMSDFLTKAFTTGDQEGGAMIVPSLYSTIINNMKALSPMRQIASIETISTSALDVVIEENLMASSWAGETDERKDTDTSKLRQKRIHVHELYAQPKATQKLLDDSEIQIESWLADRLVDSFVRAENAAFINGDGEDKPVGLLNYKGDIENIEVAADKLNVDALLQLISMLDEGFLPNATFLMNRTTLATVQKIKDQLSRPIWQPSLSDSLKQTIFGIPIVCSSNMPNIGDNTHAIALGDFKAAYKIVDRSGIGVMKDPFTEKPFVKFYSVKRVGGDAVNLNAVKLMKFKS